jgi:hypothetical protein
VPLRKADVTSTRKFEDDTDWLVLRTILTKGESDAIRDLTASYHLDPTAVTDGIEVNNRVAQANRALFEILCDSWSLGEVSGDAYSALEVESGQWVDECIAEVLRERRERAEKNGRTSKRPARRGGSSAKAAVSA